MKTNKEIFVVGTLTLAVQGALLAMFAMPLVAVAADDDVAALTRPTNFIELGAEHVSRDSAKFGEYNGLDEKGTDVIGNFRIRGGDAYNAYDGGVGTTRWDVNGTDLGTTSRNLGATISDQGKWNFGITYDELHHNIADDFQTPLVGRMGGNAFTFPSNFGVVNTALPVLGAAQVGGLQGAQALTPAQLGDFHTVDVHSDRSTTGFAAGYNFDKQWNVKFDYNRIAQSGAKLIGSGTDADGKGPNGSTFGNEKSIFLLNPTNYTTNNYTLNLNWAGDDAFFTVGYYGSFLRDGFDGLTWPNPFVSGGTPAVPTGTAFNLPLDTLSTAPSNDFNQFNLTGGYSIRPETKLVGGLSYARNRQNELYPFAIVQAGGLPATSLDGLVVTTHADLKVTDNSIKDLTLGAGVKYNERDNQTTSNIYKFITLGGGNETSVNAPMSNKKTQAELSGDYRIDSNNKLHLAYEYEGIKRWCDNDLANNNQTGARAQPAVVAAGLGYISTSCAQVPESNENKLVGDYKLKAGDALTFNAGYSYADKKADVNQFFYSPLQAESQGYENAGYVAFFDASRKEQMLKAGVNWQANDKLSVSLSGKYRDDKYDDSTLGVQKGANWSANLDATYAYMEKGAVSAYFTAQNRHRDLTNGVGNFPLPQTPPVNTFTNQLKDKDNTAGVNVTQKGLMGGKLDLGGDLTYSLGTTSYSTSPETNAAGVVANPTCGLSTSLTCGSTPDIKSEMFRAKLSGSYQLNKASKIAVGYLFQKLRSTDYAYNALQYGFNSTGVLPTNQQPQSYIVNVVSASYIYTF